MIICANCGSELSGSANFCANCGAQIVVEPVVEAVPVAEPVQEKPVASGFSDEDKEFVENTRRLLRWEQKAWKITGIVFSIMGGIFGEGIDLSNDKLIGAIIVGTGLPQICNEREILKNYYDEESGSGFDYAFRYPGMNKVLQAAGRVIRTTEDEGVILLLDDRFLQRDYQMMYPREWEQRSVCDLNSVEDLVEDFWNKKNT